MRQNKVILVAQRDDRLYQLMVQAINDTPIAPNMVRVRSTEELEAFLMGDSDQRRVVPNVPYVLIFDENCGNGGAEPVLEKILEDGNLAKIPVVMLMDGNDEPRGSLYQKMGVSISILKPDSEQDFVDTIMKLGNFLAVVQAPQL